MSEANWTPPFKATGIEDAECPRCHEEGGVHVRDQASYRDGEQVDAYCVDCHAPIVVTVEMVPHFGSLTLATNERHGGSDV